VAEGHDFGERIAHRVVNPVQALGDEGAVQAHAPALEEQDFKRRRDHGAARVAPQLVRREQLPPGQALGQPEGPVGKKLEAAERMAGEHLLRIEHDPAAGQGLEELRRRPRGG